MLKLNQKKIIEIGTKETAAGAQLAKEVIEAATESIEEMTKRDEKTETGVETVVSRIIENEVEI